MKKEASMELVRSSNLKVKVRLEFDLELDDIKFTNYLSRKADKENYNALESVLVSSNNSFGVLEETRIKTLIMRSIEDYNLFNQKMGLTCDIKKMHVQEIKDKL